MLKYANLLNDESEHLQEDLFKTHTCVKFVPNIGVIKKVASVKYRRHLTPTKNTSEPSNPSSLSHVSSSAARSHSMGFQLSSANKNIG